MLDFLIKKNIYDNILFYQFIYCIYKMTKEWFYSLIFTIILVIILEHLWLSSFSNLLIFFIFLIILMHVRKNILYIFKNIDKFLIDYFVIIILCVLFCLIFVFIKWYHYFLPSFIKIFLFYSRFFHSFIFITLWTIITAIQLPPLSDNHKSWKK